mgnify:CR=1 FL=1|jgi:streptogramin lyase
MSETLYYPTATTLLNSNTTVTGNATVLLDVTDQGAYLVPSTSNAAVIQQWMQRTINNYKNNFYSNAKTYSTVSATNCQYIGGTVIPDGRVVMGPWSTANIGIFTPSTNSYTTVAFTSGSTGSTIDQFYGSVLAPDGRVIFVPSTASCIGIYNPANNTWSTTGALGATTHKFSCGAVGPDGNVWFFPDNVTYYGYFNPSTNIFTSITPTGSTLPAGSGLIGGVITPSGLIVQPVGGYPSTTYMGVYNIKTNVFTTYPTGLSVFSGIFTGAVNLPDGRVACIPRGLSPANLGLFNPNTGAFSSITGPTSTTQNYIQGCLLPDGRVFCAPANSTSALIFDPVAGTYTTLTGFPGGNAYNGATLLPDGRVLLVPIGVNTVGLISGLNRPVPREFCLSPFFNHS